MFYLHYENDWISWLKCEKMVPHVEDNLIDQTLEIKPTKKGSNQVLSAL